MIPAVLKNPSKLQNQAVTLPELVTIFYERPSWIATGQPVPYSACDKIAHYYDRHQLKPSSSDELMGEKSYTWKFHEASQKVQIECSSYFYWLGLHHLKVKKEQVAPETKIFIDVKQINHFEGSAILQMPFQKDCKVYLPKPD